MRWKEEENARKRSAWAGFSGVDRQFSWLPTSNDLKKQLSDATQRLESQRRESNNRETRHFSNNTLFFLPYYLWDVSHDAIIHSCRKMYLFILNFLVFYEIDSCITKIILHVIGFVVTTCIDWALNLQLRLVLYATFDFKRISYIFYFAENNLSRTFKHAFEIEKKRFSCIMSDSVLIM